jgi:hypothetical protein
MSADSVKAEDRKLALSTRRKRNPIKQLVVRKKRPRSQPPARSGGRRSSPKRGRPAPMAKPTASEDSAYKRNGDATYAAAVKSFETGVRYFQKHKYERAKEVFEKLADTAPLGIADRAKVHLRLCSQRRMPGKIGQTGCKTGRNALHTRRRLCAPRHGRPCDATPEDLYPITPAELVPSARGRRFAAPVLGSPIQQSSAIGTNRSRAAGRLKRAQSSSLAGCIVFLNLALPRRPADRGNSRWG